MYLVDPVIVPVSEEVVVGHQPLQGSPHHVDVDGPDSVGPQAQAVKVHEGEVAVVQGRVLGAPAGDVVGKLHGILVYKEV